MWVCVGRHFLYENHFLVMLTCLTTVVGVIDASVAADATQTAANHPELPAPAASPKTGDQRVLAPAGATAPVGTPPPQ